MKTRLSIKCNIKLYIYANLIVLALTLNFNHKFFIITNQETTNLSIANHFHKETCIAIILSEVSVSFSLYIILFKFTFNCSAVRITIST